jgi:mono/diheme cytochrome c family protein
MSAMSAIMNTRARFQTALALIVSAALGSCEDRVSAEQRGRELFASPSFSTSRFNQYSCATCHRSAPTDRPDAVLPGALLAGVTARPTFWGGSVVALEDAVGLCFEKFMRGGRFDASAERSVDLYAFLYSIERAPGAITNAVAFTIPGATVPPGSGDAARGQRVYERACAACHGALRQSARAIMSATVIPDDTEREHGAALGYTQDTLRQVFVEKARHGAFLGFAGTMPPFSTELLSDQDLADMVAYVSPTLR